MIGAKRSLGLSLSARGAVAAEVVSSAGRRRVARAAQFELPEGLSWERPREAGERLGAWLRAGGYGRRAVLGLPAQWLVAATRPVPPVDARSLAGVLRLAAERVFSIPADEMVLDYASRPSEGEAGTALLVGARRDRVGTCSEAARAAGLKVRAITSTTAALALAGRDGAERITIQLVPDGMEAALVRGGDLRALCHVPRAQADAAAAPEALRRGIRFVLAAAGADVERLDIYDGVGTGPNAVEGTGRDLNLEVSLEPGLQVDGLGEAAREAGLPAGLAWPAAALAMAGLDRSLAPFNLGAPRLARRRPHRWGRWAARAAVVLLAVVILAVAIVADRAARTRQVGALGARLDELAPSITAAENVVQTVSTARGWHDRRPPFLDCLRALTLAFPEQGVVWATSLAVDEEMEGVLYARSVNEESALAVLDGLRQSGSFAEVKLLHIRESRGAGRDTEFAIAFTYTGGAGP